MRILLADDQHLVREALAAYLAGLWPEAEVFQASSVADALQRACENNPFDLVIVDYQLPGMEQFVGLSRLKAATGRARIVFCSGFMGRETADEAIRRGAAGVLSKDMKGSALVHALKRIVGGELIVFPSIAVADVEPSRIRLDEERRQCLGGLSGREYEVVRLLVREGSSNRVIAEQLGLAEGTVKLHLHHAFNKMAARNRADAVRIFLSACPAEESSSGSVFRRS